MEEDATGLGPEELLKLSSGELFARELHQLKQLKLVLVYNQHVQRTLSVERPQTVKL